MITYKSPSIGLKAVEDALSYFQPDYSHKKEHMDFIKQTMIKYFAEYGLLDPNFSTEVSIFSHDNEEWFGIITQGRNSFMGSIISYYKGKPLVIRGFPKIKYTDDTPLKDEECWCEEKIDGTNMGYYILPNGELIGKTRNKEAWYGTTYNNWKVLTDKTGLKDKIMDFCKCNDMILFGELYGELNQGEFVKYKGIPISFKAFNAVDRTNHQFVHNTSFIELCDSYEIPYVQTTYHGKLDNLNVNKIETEVLPTRTDIEGFVGKIMLFDSNDVFDTYMAKLKSPQTKEKCMTPRDKQPSVPMIFIQKALDKAKDNAIPEKDMFKFIHDELAEEFDNTILETSHSKNNILKAIRGFTNEPSLDQSIVEFAKTLPDDTRKAMSTLADKYPDMKASWLFQHYKASRNNS